MSRVAKGKWARVRKWPARRPPPTERAVREERERKMGPTTATPSGEEPEEE